MTVSIGVVRSAAGAANYFAQDNYYSADQAEGASQWAGEGAKELGLSGKVENDTFEKILNGQLPDDKQVGNPETRDHGRDVTFSAPKSVSLLALVTGDTRITEAYVEAVKETMAWAEKNLAEARIKVDGKDVPVRTGNLVYALFQHDTSRKTDPQLHVHAVIANMTRLPVQYRNADKVDPATGIVTKDDGWRAWHNQEVYLKSTVLTSVANSLAREKLEALGYKTELVPKGANGAFELLGPNGERINQSALDAFSKRSLQIRELAEKLGITSAEGRREITRRSRDAKTDPGDRGELQARWRAEAKENGYNGDEIYRAALSHKASQDLTRKSSVERGVIAVSNAIREASRTVADYLRKPNDPLVSPRLERLTMLPANVNTQYATASAIRILSTKEAAFDSTAIAKTALDLGLKGVTIDKVEKRVNELLQSDQLVAGKSMRHDGAVTVYTTREAIQQEQRILASMKEGIGQARPLMSADIAKNRLQELAGGRPLNPEQLSAAIQIVSSKDRIVLVQGRAGSGKSTMLQPIARAEALDATSRLLGQNSEKALLLTADQTGNAKALAFQNKMVADLKKDTGLDAMTVHSFLARNEKFLNGEATKEQFAARKEELKGTYLILDEASMISNEQMDKLTALANLMEVGRLAIVGDWKQLNPIDAGKAFVVMLAQGIKDGIPISEVITNMRQRTDDMRLVANLADSGNVRAAIQVMGDRVVETKNRKDANSVDDAAAAWLRLSPADRDKTTILPSGREERATLNTKIQEGLVQEGTLKGAGRNFNVREPADVDHEQMRYAPFWREATFLEVNNKENSLGLAPGDYKIEQIFKNGKIGLRSMDGQKIRIDPWKIDPTRNRQGLRLVTEKTIKIHEGEKIRWTASDKREGRGMINATIAQVEKVSEKGISVRLASGELRDLNNGDKMLKRMDLAYAINTHMAQGITNSVVYAVMSSSQKNLSNARSFLVNMTRQQDDAKLFTNDKEKLIRQLESNRGDKASALEAIGLMAPESTLREKEEQSLEQQSMGDHDLSMPQKTESEVDKDEKLTDPADIKLPEKDEKARSERAERTDFGLQTTESSKTEKADQLTGAVRSEAETAAKPAEREELQLDRSKGLEL